MFPALHSQELCTMYLNTVRCFVMKECPPIFFILSKLFNLEACWLLCYLNVDPSAMAWSQIKATPLHLTYVFLSTDLLVYIGLSHFFKETLLLAEPPLPTLAGNLLGPATFQIIQPLNGIWRIQLHGSYVGSLRALRCFRRCSSP
jgi:hypothetical protein